ncbi:putative tubulin polyglutamylase TTLL2 [Orchesella cincta]|uniref:Putative tubulin polyglutamylase TTLL2 n=1 Tax=Orchesella cincta TaxID=48709 RepID=A0A1D2MQN9_ORCCI|nr:putative tubulin polyglutamylase TTLL2 [Orchesella cincta]
MPENNAEVEWAGESGTLHDENYLSTGKQFHKSTKNAPVIYCTSFKNKYFATSRYRESIVELRKRAAREKALDDITLLNAVKANYRFVYRINDGIGTTNTILQKVCEERGWREFQERQSGTPYEKAMKGATGWNLWWSYNLYQFSPYKYLRHWQFTNHNPKGFQFCNKLYLTHYLRKMKSIHGPIFDFYPTSFIVPEDYLRLNMEQNKRSESCSLYTFHNLLTCTKDEETQDSSLKMNTEKLRKRVKTPLSSHDHKGTSNSKAVAFEQRCSPVWISKPIGQSQGKGIFLTTDLSNIATDKKSVIQEYISRPLLIGGYKWDIRLYVCVSAIDPLVIYIYQEGLCRFATEKYDTSDLTAMYSHLTNASLNKLSPTYEEDKELIGQGCKWPLRKLRQYFKDQNIPDWYMWQNIMAMIVLTVIGDSLRLGYSASNRNCFDLFGFDILVDEELRPWLLECNYSPGLGGDCETDEIVKKPMLHDLFDLLGFPDRSSYTKSEDTSAEADNRGGGDAALSGEEVLNSDNAYAIDATRQYVDMLLQRIANADAIEKKRSEKYKPEYCYSTAARLKDAKSIYSQNLVVQYLRNQTNGKMCKQVKDLILAQAAKRFKKTNTNLENQKSNSPTRCTSKEATTTRVKDKESSETTVKEDSLSLDHQEQKVAPKSTNNYCSKKQAEFPHPSSEAFQKLKHYFDAGVDYPVDTKTGKFTGCPALITVKKNWFDPPKQQGQWIRVYPFDARTTKSPYKSSLTDIRQAVRSIETFMKVAEHLFMTNPNETDDYYRRKVKAICRRETEIWTPPPVCTINSSKSESTDLENNNMDEEEEDIRTILASNAIHVADTHF